MTKAMELVAREAAKSATKSAALYIVHEAMSGRIDLGQIAETCAICDAIMRKA